MHIIHVYGFVVVVLGLVSSILVFPTLTNVMKQEKTINWFKTFLGDHISITALVADIICCFFFFLHLYAFIVSSTEKYFLLLLLLFCVQVCVWCCRGCTEHLPNFQIDSIKLMNENIRVEIEFHLEYPSDSILYVVFIWIYWLLSILVLICIFCVTGWFFFFLL